jgi:hypothetical protein
MSALDALFASLAQVLGNSPNAGNLPATGLRGVSYAQEADNGLSGAAKTINWSVGDFEKLSLTANCTLTFQAPPGVARLTLKLVQDATGSRLVTWPAAVKWASGTPAVLSTAAGSTDLVELYFDGALYHARLAIKGSA